MMDDQAIVTRILLVYDAIEVLSAGFSPVDAIMLARLSTDDDATAREIVRTAQRVIDMDELHGGYEEE